MTPSKEAKELGLRSIVQVQDALGFKIDGKHIVSAQTLSNWNDNKPELFNAVLTGVAFNLGLTEDSNSKKVIDD